MNISTSKKYNKTLVACFVGYIIQAIVNIFIPLLFIRFREEFSLSLSQISLMISANFAIQLCIDAAAAVFVDRIGYRASAMIAMVCSFLGLFSLSFLPDLVPCHFAGFMICTVLYAVGGGLIEVIISPIIESCPTPNKQTAMSLLHSFYCWGSVAIIALSTVFFEFVGIEHWRVATVLWSIVPFLDGILFLTVPLCNIVGDDEEKIPIKQMFSSGLFWLFLVLMACSGSSELAVTQWASVYAEKTLGIPKAVGDIAGPMFFALCAAIVRTLYGKYGERANLYKLLTLSGLLCIGSYLLLGLTKIPAIGLLACGLCGVSTSLMWPGTLSIASKHLRRCGTAMFAFLALAGDLGCTVGPAIVGFVSERTGENIRLGFLSATVIPVVLFVSYFALQRKNDVKKD